MKIRCQGFSVVFVITMSVGSPAYVSADARSDYLIESMKEGASFRVRVQAALALGSIGRQSGSDRGRVVKALVEGLSDEHPAVRAASADALGRVAMPMDKNAMAALDRAMHDDDAAVRQSAMAAKNSTREGMASNARAKFYIAVGPTAARASVDSTVLQHAQYVIMREMSGIPSVMLAPEGEPYTQAAQKVRSKKLIGYYLDSSLVRLVEQGGMTRAEVSVVVSSYPERDIRMMLNGAAAAEGGRESDEIRKQIVEVAFSSALRKFSQTLDASRATRVSRTF